MIKVALAGNPNTGKTSLFNLLTGSYEYVGNWPGVTVEKKVGKLKSKTGDLIDLPGIYTLNPLSKDEGVATRFLIDESFHAIVNVVDASQIERNLYLTVQLLELGKPMLLALNMVDVANGRGLTIDYRALGKALRTPVVPIVARSGKGINELEGLLRKLGQQSAEPLMIYYGAELEKAISALSQLMPQTLPLNKRWIALQLLDGNDVVLEWLSALANRGALLKIVMQTEEALRRKKEAKSLSHFIRKVRMDKIKEIVKESVRVQKTNRRPLTERVDDLATHRLLGLPIFFLLMFLMFKLTFDWLGTPMSDRLSAFVDGPVTIGIKSILDLLGASPFLHDVVLSGIIPGVGGVLVFVPQIFILFFMISLIEDSGYMARVAVVLDKIAEAIGLNGKAFIPMIIGFGCNVPGVMATRSIEQPRDRLLTILLLPMMSCSARLTVFSLFVGTFFTAYQALIVLSLYMLGIAVSIALAKLFSSTILRQANSGFVIELPPYRMPQTRTLVLSTWEKGKGFVRKAGTLIFGGSVAIWLLSYSGPEGWKVAMDHSFLAYLGGLLVPILQPLGFGSWQAGSALITGFLAKEVVVSTMNIIYAAPDMNALQGMISRQFSPLQAYSFMVFLLLYVPCLATVGAIRKEAMSAKWTLFSIGYALLVAYVLALVIYHGGRWLGLG